MNIVKTIDQFDIAGVFFNEPIKNNIMNEGQFVRILYSTDTFVLNGIYLLVNLNNIFIEQYFNKFRCSFNVDLNKDIINSLKDLEEQIIEKAGLHINNKVGQFKLYEQLQSGIIKLFFENNKINNYNINTNKLILKISGIWETDTNYGLTFKFTNVNV